MAIKQYVKNFQRSAIFIIKLLLFFILFCLFFGLFSIDNPQILVANRTSAITMTTFVIVGLSMTAIYGGFAVGKKKSKAIIPSLSIATFITDFITYFQLSIMNVNIYNERTFTFQNVGIFFLVLLFQIVIISLFVYFGNYVYFKVNPPEKCVIVCSEIKNAAEIIPKISRYKRQYKLTDIITFEDKDLKEIIKKSDSVFLFDIPAQSRSEIIDYAYKHFVNIYITTQLADVVTNYAKPIIVDDLAMLCSNIKGLSFEQKFIKRTLDILFSGIALVVLSPIMLIEAICIKLYDKGPVLFKQQRVTLNGKLFDVLKFRTMVVDADKIEGYRPATDNDDRITPVGKILRKIRIDELPQLFNIIKGEMSIVGPRPERIEHVEKYTHNLPEFKYRLRAKAGLTGLAQIAGKYNTSPKDKLILDLMYIERYSVWMDIILMFQTLSVFFKSDSTEGFNDEKTVEFINKKIKEDKINK